ncbi:chromosome partitioning protein, ParB family [Loktanella sp. DSM 29012]|uniref:ParB/RepB/Spo0J family partition protein n=1 Tax=Loktanella sp. DSM 29012 TaxID=1881056 RepID=UPI0008B4FAFB|nr:ParB N-terminal domain-containing protein [Loktanella sp. DSM 29012]SEQ59079.1 chromosome partitioning protein, ParB family [Loktanella sp. DSM 29012]
MSRAKYIPTVTALSRSSIAIPKDRLREVDPIAIGSIVRSIEEHGLLTPIIVRRLPKGQFELIDGAHRMAALKLLKLDDIPVRCYEGPAAAIRLIEIDANLARADLNDLDRAIHLAARRREYLAEHPETAQGKAGAVVRWDASADSALVSFVTQTERQTGLSRRKIFKLIEAGEAINKAMAARLHAAPARTTLNDLLAFAKADPDLREDAVEAFANGEVKKLAQALKPVRHRSVKDPVEQQLMALRDAWARSSKAARKRFVAMQADDLTALLDAMNDGGADPQ